MLGFNIQDILWDVVRVGFLGLGLAVQGSVFRGILRWGIIDFLDRRWVRFSRSTILGPAKDCAIVTFNDASRRNQCLTGYSVEAHKFRLWMFRV